MVDQTRRTYTKQELIEMPERVKMFTRLTEICSELIKLRYGGAKPV
tara:strand:+ start:250 stop:387 length:138 start_codon:yes stop_codon:yes gene_type:complete